MDKNDTLRAVTVNQNSEIKTQTDKHSLKSFVKLRGAADLDDERAFSYVI